MVIPKVLVSGSGKIIDCQESMVTLDILIQQPRELLFVKIGRAVKDEIVQISG